MCAAPRWGWLRGEYDSHRHFLVDNRMLGSRVGYVVITPLLADDVWPGALQPLPTVLGFPSETHRGYAAQWLALGALVLFGWIGFGIRRAAAGK